ncbi:MAG: ATP-binding protein [Clostridiales bacterium]|nr:ATP-binding protein [Clostridiales bacterium]
MKRKVLPVGTDDFTKARTQNLYYIDKTGFIKELLENKGEVNLFTRPRRFGKTLNMSMLKNFFEIGSDKSLFDGLDISKETKLCEKHMGQYPVIAVSLKEVSGDTFEEAKENLWDVIKAEAERFDYLQDSAKLNNRDKLNLLNLSGGIGNLASSLKLMSRILYKEYDKRVIILIDEYDAPLQKAHENGYYKKMVLLIRQLFGYALKSNEFLHFGVLTGCLRVSKESIFSDLNNPKVFSLVDERCDEWFGFTDDEVKELLDTYELSKYYDTAKDWYDGYQIGSTSLYCPWDIINYCDYLLTNSNKAPQNFWANVSENGIIRNFADKADRKTLDEIEKLIAGESVKKRIRTDLTYPDINSTVDNLWGILFTTGYLTCHNIDENGFYELTIPNREIKNLFEDQITTWFDTKVYSDTDSLNLFCNAFPKGDAATIENHLNTLLRRSVSIRDSQVPEEKKENFYHGLLLGILNSRPFYWNVESNQESGKGFPDIRVVRPEDKYGFIIEIKYADNEETLNKYAEKALKQIDDKNYEHSLSNMGITDIKCYGIAFYKKLCRVLLK